MNVKQVVLIAAILLTMFVMPAVAADNSVVEYTADGTYELTIPKEIPLDTSAKSGSAEIKLTKCVIDSGDTIAVTMTSENEMNLMHSTGLLLGYGAKSSDGVVITNGGIVLSVVDDGVSTDMLEGTELIQFSLNEDVVIKKAGSYTDTLSFTVEIYTNKVASVEELANAFTNAGEGDTILVAAGDYASFPTPAKGVSIVGTLDENGEPATTFNSDSGRLLSTTLEDVTFKNLKLTGDDVVRYSYAKGDVVFEGCTIEMDGDGFYGVHFDGNAGGTVTLKDCTITGFNAFAAALEMVTFENCVFKGNGISAYNGANLWGSATMIKCEFTFDGTSTYEWIDCIGVGKTYVFTDCTVNGVDYTPDNFESYKDFIDLGNDVTVKINGVDCVL